MSEVLREKIKQKKAKIGIIGLGYVGLPLAVEFSRRGFTVHGIDVDNSKIKLIQQKKNYIKDVINKDFLYAINNRLFTASATYDKVGEQDIFFICVPTPVTPNKTPDISYIMNATEEIFKRMKRHTLFVLKSTTFPGTTEDYVMPLLERKGWKAGKDYYLAFSPERVDPGNKTYNTGNTPIVVGGVTRKCAELSVMILQEVATKVHTVSSPRVAEMEKLLENIFRSVNIALVNEMALLCDRMGNINIWEVIEAASTKPFGFMPFYPGPGIGGHCIQIDPYYLDWQARQYDFHTKFIELAAESNEEMPFYVKDLVMKELAKLSVNSANANVLILGTTFKRDVDDPRNSPAIKVIELLYKEGIPNINFHDPYMRNIRLLDRIFRVQELNEKLLRDADVTVIITDHTNYDYEWIVAYSKRIIDTRNATKKIRNNREKITLLGAGTYKIY
ncbi:MAG: nucleotide sugar dehydrogenase [Chlorobi bacterium]|nr:nucleotide sugar dehydrogenase [Chlorobiota bacterium]MCI0716172.1 nucleotide sugar dehydrogenase [Chlorobiota bacterium]